MQPEHRHHAIRVDLFQSCVRSADLVAISTPMPIPLVFQIRLALH